MCHRSQHEVTITNFEAIDGKTLQETVQHLKTSICCLETLSTSFFKMSLAVLDRIYWIVNPLVLFLRPFFKVFENKLLGLSLKRSSRMTQLKKQTKNYSTISNLPFIGKIRECCFQSVETILNTMRLFGQRPICFLNTSQHRESTN